MSEVEHAIRAFRADVPVQVEALIRSLGVHLEAEAELAGEISGHIQRQSSGQYVIRTNRREHLFRRRFTMAHELGHYVLHRSVLDKAGGINDSTLYRTDPKSPHYNSHIHRAHERQANSFAANLLMPDEAVRDHWSEWDSNLQSLYRQFQVSPSAMKWKLRNLGLEVVE